MRLNINEIFYFGHCSVVDIKANKQESHDAEFRTNRIQLNAEGKLNLPLLLSAG